MFEAQETQLTWSFKPDEVDLYLDTFSKYIDDFEEGSELRERARDQLLEGDDGILKALLIVLCPRLRRLYYAFGSFVYTRLAQERIGDVGNSSLSWLSKVIMSHRDMTLEKWPPGLQSLRHLAIGVHADPPPPRIFNRLYPPLFMAKMLNLPNLGSFYLWGLGPDERYDEDEISYPLTPGCSSVRHIYLESFWRLEFSVWEPVLHACKNQVSARYLLVSTGG